MCTRLIVIEERKTFRPSQRQRKSTKKTWKTILYIFAFAFCIFSFECYGTHTHTHKMTTHWNYCFIFRGTFEWRQQHYFRIEKWKKKKNKNWKLRDFSSDDIRHFYDVWHIVFIFIFSSLPAIWYSCSLLDIELTMRPMSDTANMSIDKMIFECSSESLCLCEREKGRMLKLIDKWHIALGIWFFSGLSYPYTPSTTKRRRRKRENHSIEWDKRQRKICVILLSALKHETSYSKLEGSKNEK